MSPELPVERRAVEVRVTGRVQGVGYRAFVHRHAVERGLGGWVRNRPDGSVEAFLEGPAAELESLVALLRRGPAGGRVDAVQTAEASPRGDASFHITW